MHARKVTMIAFVLSFGLFTLEGSALAQEESARAQRDCRQAKGRQVAVSDGGTTTGTITNGGRLNGTTLEVFNSCSSVLWGGTLVSCINGALPTPDPTTVTFAGDFTLTTNHGQLKASNVYLFNFAGVGTVLGRINPTTSTGRFAGATGVLYLATKVTSFSPFTVQNEIAGEICFAK